MNDDYKTLENFIIAATNDLGYYWTMKNGYLWQTEFIHEQDRFRRININFEFNDDTINIVFKNTKIKDKRIQINVDKVPNLMSYLADKQNYLEKKERLQKNISEQEFDEINLNLTKILRDGKLKEKSLIRHYLYDTNYDIDLDERKSISIYFVPIDNNILGFQKITSIITNLDTNEEFMRFNRVVPRHQIKEFPFLNSIVNLPNFNNKDLEPNIEEFISYFTNWAHIGPIAQKIVFANELKNELNSNQNINKKTNKM